MLIPTLTSQKKERHRLLPLKWQVASGSLTLKYSSLKKTIHHPLCVAEKPEVSEVLILGLPKLDFYFILFFSRALRQKYLKLNVSGFDYCTVPFFFITFHILSTECFFYCFITTVLQRLEFCFDALI